MQLQQAVAADLKALGRSSYTLCVDGPLLIRQALHPEASKKVGDRCSGRSFPVRKEGEQDALAFVQRRTNVSEMYQTKQPFNTITKSTTADKKGRVGHLHFVFRGMQTFALSCMDGKILAPDFL